MITKQHIDALVASKTELYRSAEYFRKLDHAQMLSSIRNEIQSLAELADHEFCLKRHQRFNIPGAVPSDYEERIIVLDESHFLLAGIRFQGLDINHPYVSVMGNFRKAENIPFSHIAKVIREEFRAFAPHSFHMSFPAGAKIIEHNFKINQYTLMGNIKEIVNMRLAPIHDKVELVSLGEMNFYEEYSLEYEKLYDKSPHLRNEVKVEKLNTLNDAAKDKLLFEVLINSQRAGLIAGYINDCFGKQEVCILEEILFRPYRGKGLGVYIQKAFAEKMENRFEILWGHISGLNPSSLKTALKNGRGITETELQFDLNGISAVQALPSEYEDIYMMGYDVWADGASKSDYLTFCKNSSKYKRGKWYVLKEGELLLSSLIVYTFSEGVFGIGSIATPDFLRKKGFASKLISQVIALLENNFSSQAIFLYSDIEPTFYKKFGFTSLPLIHQRYKGTYCMARLKKSEGLRDPLIVPEYF